MLTIVSTKRMKYLEDVEQLYKQQQQELFELKDKYKKINVLLADIRIKLKNENVVIYDIKEDKYGNIAFVCIDDIRRPEICSEGKRYLNGHLSIFIIGSAILSQNNCMYSNNPHLYASFKFERVIINELHSDMCSNQYENMGYGTMMIEALKEIALNSNCTLITGMLSSVDAITDKKRDKRNSFYEHRGFELHFSNGSKKDGSIHMKIKKE